MRGSTVTLHAEEDFTPKQIVAKLRQIDRCGGPDNLEEIYAALRYGSSLASSTQVIRAFLLATAAQRLGRAELALLRNPLVSAIWFSCVTIHHRSCSMNQQHP